MELFWAGPSLALTYKRSRGQQKLNADQQYMDSPGRNAYMFILRIRGIKQVGPSQEIIKKALIRKYWA